MTSAGAATAMASRTPEDALAALARVQARMREFRQAKQDAVRGQAKAADAMAGRAGRHVDLPPEIRIARGDVDLEERAITERARELLDWTAERDLPTMCADAWRWQSQNPNGYRLSAA